MNTLKHRRSLSCQSSSSRIIVGKKLQWSLSTDSPRSAESSPRRSEPHSTESSPRRSSQHSSESSPRSTESSPRRKIHSIIHKFKPIEEPPSQHPSIYPLRDEYGRELGKYHYELFEYAMTGNLFKIKEIFDRGDYNQNDKTIVIDTAIKYEHPDVAFFVSNYN